MHGLNVWVCVVFVFAFKHGLPYLQCLEGKISNSINETKTNYAISINALYTYYSHFIGFPVMSLFFVIR